MSPIRHICLTALTAMLPWLSQSANSAELTPRAINDASYSGGSLPEGQSAIVARIQVLLDRHHSSPGVIDGYAGENLAKATRGFERMHDLPVDGVMDEKVWAELAGTSRPAIVRHKITGEDRSRIVPPLPEDYSKLAERDWLGYTSVAEKIAERFHMDLEFLRALNPDVDFFKAGAEIWVASPGEDADATVKRVAADKSNQQLLAFGGDDQLVAAYPVTIGSDDLPSPSGTHEVTAIATEPTYSYRPDKNFVQAANTEPLVLPPGPNGPVGLVWIDLSKPTYGIHGSAEPDLIDKTFSHGCVRMTNWDALELAALISVGVPVQFKE